MAPKVRRITEQTLIFVVDIVLDDIHLAIHWRVELASESNLQR